MPNELLDGAIAAYGLPGAVSLWLLYSVFFGKPRKDPADELIDTLRSMDKRLNTVNERLIRVETKVEMMK